MNLPGFQKRIKITFLSFILFSLFIVMNISCSAQEEKNNNKAIEIAESFLSLHPDTVAYKSETKSYKWNYEQGLVLEAFYQLWKSSGKEKYFDYIKKNIDYYVEDNGNIKTYKLEDYNLDNIAPGRQLLHLYKKTGEKKYKLAADLLMKQIESQPTTSEGGYWHKKRYPYQMWLDGLYMAEPFCCEYAAMFDDKKLFNDVAKQFLLVDEHCKDESTDLYYHGWDESREQRWSNPETGTSPSFWGRAIGWYMMALVDVLDSFPAKHQKRNDLIKIFQDLAVSLLKYRDSETKLWYEVVDQGNREGNYIETSSSLMFIYSFAKGVNKGYLDKKYFSIAKESFESLSKNFVSKDNKGYLFLNNTVSVGGLGGDPYRDGSFEYYLSEPIRVNDFKGYGPLLLSAIELYKN